MLDNQITISYDSESVVLNRINNGDPGGLFNGQDAAGNDYVLEVKHVFPKSSVTSGVEQHLVKLTRTTYVTVDGILTLGSVVSVHEVLKTSVGVEDDTVVEDLHNAVQGYLTSTELGKILDRRS
jgi:hypothetical protein